MTTVDLLKLIITKRFEEDAENGEKAVCFSSACLVKDCDSIPFESYVQGADESSAKASSISKAKMHLINDHGYKET